MSHPLQVLAHCLAIEADDEQVPAAKSRSHVARGMTLTLLAHLSSVVILALVLVEGKTAVEVVVVEVEDE